jgi:hypothetical protein
MKTERVRVESGAGNGMRYGVRVFYLGFMFYAMR